MHPARDIFTQPAQLVASLVVVPLVHGDGAPRAALYLSLEQPNDFTNIQAPLLVSVGSGVRSCVPALVLRWRGQGLPSAAHRAQAAQGLEQQ